MRVTLGAWRIGAALGLLVRGALTCAFVFPFVDAAGRERRVGEWSRRMLRTLGVTLDSRGLPRGGSTLLVANHVSWLDILAINAVRPVRFVSKADVRHWPVIGWLVASAGTLFIERERKRDALRVVHQVADALRQGQTIAVFPEGTTSVGHAVLPFHANLLQAAIATSTPVQPLALRFSDRDDAVSRAAAYVDDDHLLGSLWAVVTTPGLRASLRWLPALESAHAERRLLAERLRHEIGAALNVTE